jgi:uncharacterized protein (DUF1330 family)
MLAIRWAAKPPPASWTTPSFTTLERWGGALDAGNGIFWMNAGPKELNEGFVRSLADDGPVVMVNLLRFKEKSADGDGSGWDAYLRYSKAISPLLKAVGGTILWAGHAEGAVYGDLEAKQWEFVALVRYPSRQAFLKMVTSPEYARANVHRENAVDDHVILATAETYSKFPPPGDESLTLSSP